MKELEHNLGSALPAMESFSFACNSGIGSKANQNFMSRLNTQLSSRGVFGTDEDTAISRSHFPEKVIAITFSLGNTNAQRWLHVLWSKWCIVARLWPAAMPVLSTVVFV